MKKHKPKYKHIKRVIILFFIIVGINQSLFPQEYTGIFVTSQKDDIMITVNSNTSLFVTGDINLSQNEEEDVYIKNSGNIYSTGALINGTKTKTGEFTNFFFHEVPNGTYHYVGQDTLFLKGDSIHFFNLHNDSTTVLFAENDAIVYNDFTVNKDINLLGDIELRYRAFDIPGSNDLYLRGKIVGEDNDKSIYNNPSDTGFIYSNILQTNELEARGMGLAVYPDNDYELAQVKREHHRKRRAADGSIRKSFHINVNSGGNNEVKFKYFDRDFSDLGSNEEDFKLWYWNIDNGTIPFRKIGNSDVDMPLNEVKASNFQFSSGDYHQLTVSDEKCANPPQINFPEDTSFCEGASIILSADNYNGTTSNEGFKFLWKLGEDIFHENDTMRITVTEHGEYSVCVTDTNQCFTYDTINVTENPNPVAGFKAPQLAMGRCQNKSFSFQDTSKITGGGTLTYYWDFGDYDFSTEQNPEKLYDKPDLYNVSLIASSPFGCSDTTTGEVRIHPVPKANFENENSCSIDPIKFNNLSSITPNIAGMNYVINTYIYDYGDSNNDTIPSNIIFPYLSHSYKYALMGTYNVKLKVKTNAGCIDSITKVVQVYPEANADFAFNNSCESEKVSFTNNSSANCTIFHWDFGNSNTSEHENPEFTFTSPGVFDVQLITESDDGCIDTIVKQITIYPLPEVNFTLNDICQNSEVSFLNSSLISSGQIDTYSWNFGNKNTSADESPTATYSDPGNYDIKLICTSNNLCVDSITKEITIHPNPVAAFTASKVCQGEDTEFINNSYISNGELEYSWEFGDNNTSSETNPEHGYLDANDYTAILTATSQFGCSDITNKTVTVHTVPEIEIGDNPTCKSSTIVNAGNPECTYEWSNNATGQSITIDKSDDYWVRITNVHGCKFTEYFKITLDSEVQPNLGNDITVCDFTVLDANYPDEKTIYKWDTGNDSRYLTVTSSGTYSVTVTDQNRCKGKDTIQVTVNSSPEVSLGSDIVECEGTLIELTIDNPTGEEILWSTNETTNRITVNTSGDYWVSLTNNYGCIAYDTVNIQILELPEEPFDEEVTACGFTVLDAANPGSTYLWSNNSTERTLEVTSSGTYSVDITQNGCSITDEINVIINPEPIVELEDINICEGVTTLLDAGNSGASFSWSNEYTGQINQVRTAGIFEVEVTNKYGCSGSGSATVTTTPSPVFNIGSDATICNNSEAIIYDLQVEAESYAWFNESGRISRRKYIEIDEPGLYWMTATNSLGCTWTDSVNIYKNPYSVEADFLVASDIYAGDTIQFIDISSPKPESYLWLFGDGLADTISDPQHIYYQTGVFTVILEIKSGACSASQAKDINVKKPNKLLDGAETDISAEKLPKIIYTNLYPNPNNGQFYCEIELSDVYDIYVFIYNLKGSLVHNYKIPKQDYKLEEFSLGHLSPGMYILKIIVENETKVYKFVKH